MNMKKILAAATASVVAVSAMMVAVYADDTSSKGVIGTFTATNDELYNAPVAPKEIATVPTDVDLSQVDKITVDLETASGSVNWQVGCYSIGKDEWVQQDELYVTWPEVDGSLSIVLDDLGGITSYKVAIFGINNIVEWNGADNVFKERATATATIKFFDAEGNELPKAADSSEESSSTPATSDDSSTETSRCYTSDGADD